VLDARLKKMFFDRKAVMNAIERAERRVLARFGGLVRTIARRSIKRDRKPSEPGRPPHSHTGLLKDNILFGYDPYEQSVIIGPIKLHSGTDAPELLEHGGTVVTKKPRWIPTGKTRPDGRPQTVRVPAGTALKYEARPYMGPAFEAAKPKLDPLWANSVR